MRRVSGIKFKDPKFLRDFEREARRRFAEEEVTELLSSYTIHCGDDDDSVVLEFCDVDAVQRFLEKARAVAVAGRTIRIIKLVALTPTGLYRMPVTDVDNWAHKRIGTVTKEGRQRDSLICSAEEYSSLEGEFRGASVDLSKYVH